MKQYTIYLATNKINGKQYVGFDRKWPKRRQDHLRYAFYPEDAAYNTHFHRAIRKHGIDNFNWKILYQHWDGEYCLYTMEPLFIETFNTLHNGYNMTAGGDGSLKRMCSPETRNKMKQSMLVRFTDPEERKKTSETTKKAMDKWWKLKTLDEQEKWKKQSSHPGNKFCVGRKASEETKMKMSMARKGKKLPKRTEDQNKSMSDSKSHVWKITVPTGTTVHIKGLAKYCESLGISGISAKWAAKHKKWHKGYFFERLNTKDLSHF